MISVTAHAIRTLSAVLTSTLVIANTSAEPLTPKDRSSLETIRTSQQHIPYRLSWTEYAVLPPELLDEFKKAGLDDTLTDPRTGQPLYALYERTFLTDGVNRSRKDSLDLSLAGPMESRYERHILNNGTSALISAGPSSRPTLMEFKPSNNSLTQQREAWARQEGTYEMLKPDGVFQEVVAMAATRLLEDPDTDADTGADGSRVFTSNFWRIEIVLDPQGRVRRVTTGEPNREMDRKARYEVLERFPDGPSKGKPEMIRVETWWPTDSDDWELNQIQVLQPTENPGPLSAGAFEWQTFSKTALVGLTGEIIDHDGKIVAKGEKNRWTRAEMEEMSKKRASADSRIIAMPDNRPGPASRTLSRALIITGSCLVLGGGGVVLWRRINP